MRRLQELQATVLDVGNVAAHKFQLEPVAVVRAAKQHRLFLEGHPQFTIPENLGNDILGLGIAVFDSHVLWLTAIAALRKQVLAVLPLAFRDQAIRAIQYRLRRAIVLLERNDLRGGDELIRKSEDVLDFRRTKRINGLRIVADNGDAVTDSALVP